MRGEFGERDGLAQHPRQVLEQAHEASCDAGSDLAFETDAEQEAGGPLLHRQNG